MQLLIVSLTLTDITGVIFITRQKLTETTTFRDCVFQGCQSAGSGGALYLSDPTTSFSRALPLR
jgi:hypothetical protein